MTILLENKLKGTGFHILKPDVDIWVSGTAATDLADFPILELQNFIFSKHQVDIKMYKWNFSHQFNLFISLMKFKYSSKLVLLKRGTSGIQDESHSQTAMCARHTDL